MRDWYGSGMSSRVRSASRSVAGWRAEDVAWSPDGDLLAVAGGESETTRTAITVFDREGELVTTIDDFHGT